MFKVLCVGGPLDGKMRAFQYGRQLTVPIAKGFKLTNEPGESPDLDKSSLQIEYFVYRAHPFHISDSEELVWIAGRDEESAADVLTQLVVGYADLVDRFNKMKEH